MESILLITVIQVMDMVRTQVTIIQDIMVPTATHMVNIIVIANPQLANLQIN